MRSSRLHKHLLAPSRLITVIALAGTGTVVSVASQSTPASASANYSSVVLSDAPLAYWRFGESPGATTAADSSPSGYNGTYTSCMKLGIKGAIRSDPNTAGFFGKTVGCWMTSTPATSITGSFTAEAWVKPGSTTKTYQTIVGSRAADSGDSSGEYSFDVTLTGTNFSGGQELYSDVGDGTNWLQTGGVPFTYQAGKWYDIAVTVDQARSVVIYYANGSFVGAYGLQIALGSGGPLLIADPNHPFTVGGSPRFDLDPGNPSPQNFDGTIDEVAVYPAVLSPARVQAHYAAGHNA